MAIHEVDIFFYLKKCSGESGTVFIDYKTVLRDELNFFCFVMTADFSLRLKLQEQQGKLQFRLRNDWIDRQETTLLIYWNTPFSLLMKLTLFILRSAARIFWVEISLT